MNHPESSSKDVHCQLLGGQGSASPDPLNFPYNFKVIPEPPNLRLNSQSYQESLRGLLKANYFSRNVLESCPLLPMHGWLTGRSCYGVLGNISLPPPRLRLTPLLIRLTVMTQAFRGLWLSPWEQTGPDAEQEARHGSTGYKKSYLEANLQIEHPSDPEQHLWLSLGASTIGVSLLWPKVASLSAT